MLFGHDTGQMLDSFIYHAFVSSELHTACPKHGDAHILQGFCLHDAGLLNSCRMATKVSLDLLLPLLHAAKAYHSVTNMSLLMLCNTQQVCKCGTTHTGAYVLIFDMLHRSGYSAKVPCLLTSQQLCVQSAQPWHQLCILCASLLF